MRPKQDRRDYLKLASLRKHSDCRVKAGCDASASADTHGVRRRQSRAEPTRERAIRFQDAGVSNAAENAAHVSSSSGRLRACEKKATAGFWNPQMSCTPACAQLQAARPQNGAAMRRCGQARGDTLGQPTPRGDNTTTLDRNNPENPCRVVGAQLWNMSKKVIGRSEVRLPAGTSKTSRRTARGCGEGDAAGVGGFAAFAGQESKCLGGHGWPREAPSPGALRAPTSPTRGEVESSLLCRTLQLQ